MKKVHVIGSYHADLAWKKDAAEMAELWESFIVRLIDLLETYPDFTYVVEQAAHFRQLAISRPDLVRRISSYVQEGRVEVMGGMASTMDTNMPCGESFVRNMILGLEWFHEHMGIDVKTGWLIDTFGINAQVPQLLAQAGIRHLMANRLGNDMTRDLFIAVGLDGSKITVAGRDVFAGAIPDARVLFKFTQTWKQIDQLCDRAAEASGDGSYLLMPYIENECLPSKRIDMNLKTLQAKADGVYGYSLPHRFFSELDQEKMLPEVFADLNPEFTGTYSLRIPIKLINRRVEHQLLDAEKWACLLGSEPGETRKEIDQAWWLMAFNHFHDVFTGSHPTVVFNHVVDHYRQVEQTAEKIMEHAMGASLIKRVQPGVLSIVNGLPRARREMVSIPLDRDSDCGYEVWRQGERISSEEHDGCLRFAADMPATSISEYTISQTDAKTWLAFKAVSQAVIENEYLAVAASREKGIEAIILKPDHVLVKQAGVLLAVQRDRGNFQIEEPDGDEIPVLTNGAELLIAESPLGQRLCLKGVLNDPESATPITILAWSMELFLPHGEQRIDLAFKIDWQATGFRLRLNVPTMIQTSAGIYEIPFGTVSRKAYPPGVSKKGEWPAQRFVTLEDESFGVALINTGVPGVEIADGIIRSTLLRAPTSEYAGMIPDDTSSQHGQHDFSFAIVPYRGEWQDSPVFAYAESLNSPACIVKGSGSLMLACDSLVRLEGGTTALSCIKLPQDQAPGEIVLRLYEYGGRESRTILQIKQAMAAWMTDLLERKGEEIAVTAQGIHVILRPYEIMTIRIKRE